MPKSGHIWWGATTGRPTKHLFLIFSFFIFSFYMLQSHHRAFFQMAFYFTLQTDLFFWRVVDQWCVSSAYFWAEAVMARNVFSLGGWPALPPPNSDKAHFLVSRVSSLDELLAFIWAGIYHLLPHWVVKPRVNCALPYLHLRFPRNAERGEKHKINNWSRLLSYKDNSVCWTRSKHLLIKRPTGNSSPTFCHWWKF